MHEVPCLPSRNSLVAAGSQRHLRPGWAPAPQGSGEGAVTSAWSFWWSADCCGLEVWKWTETRCSARGLDAGKGARFMPGGLCWAAPCPPAGGKQGRHIDWGAGALPNTIPLNSPDIQGIPFFV